MRSLTRTTRSRSSALENPRALELSSRRRPTLRQRRKCYNRLMKAHVWVMPKRTVLDPQGQTIQHALAGLGYAEVKDVRQGKFFVLELGGWTRKEPRAQSTHI